MAASSTMSRTFARQSPRSRISTIVIGVLKNWASCHPTKPVRLMPCERPPELQNRVQTIRAGTAVLFDERTKHPAKLAVRRHLQELVLACLRQCSETEAIVTAEDGTWFAAAAPLNGRPGLALLRLTAMHHLGRGLRGRLQRLFGLTTAEAEMTVLLANGGSLEAIAEARGVSVDTVRTQLRRVFTKTGIHRQGELVCAVGRLAAG